MTSPKLPWSLRHGYGVAAFAVAIANTAVMFFVLKFLVDVAGLAPGTAGLVIFAGKVWDAVTDPLVGRLSDRTRTAMGRRRPWILGGAAPFALAFVGLFWGVPLQGVAAAGVTLLLLVAYSTAFTAVVVPYGALTPELTDDYDERTRLNGARMAWSMGGGIVSGVTLPVIVNRVAPDLVGLPPLLDGHPWRLGVLVLAPLAFLPLLLTVWVTRGRDRPPPPSEAQAPPMWSVLRVQAFRRTALLFLASWSCMGVLSSLVPFYVEHHLGDVKLVDGVFAAIQLGALCCVPLAVLLARKLEKHVAYAICIASWALVQLGLALVPAGTGVAALAVAALVGPGVAAAHVLPWSMLPDVIEADAVETGQDRAGAFYGVMTFLEKSATGLAIWCLGVGLELAGYVEGAASQPDSAKLAIRVLMGPVPALILLGAAVAAVRYPPLTRALHQALLRSLDASPASRSAGPHDARPES
ncbi:MAG: MFS transporter [Alphaproteobacteria bacterium]|nr:MFS transporter [Alphaproteobacteria bacterium]